MISISKKTIHNLFFISSLLFSPALATTYAIAQQDLPNAEDRFVYVGGDFGISEPIWKNFKNKQDGKTTKIRLKKSRMIGGRIGYSPYPNIMVEISATNQPKFNMGYTLPAAPESGLPEKNGRTKVEANVFTANIIYQLQPIATNTKPYVIFGAGIAQVKVLPTSSYLPPQMAKGVSFARGDKVITDQVEYFRLKKTSSNCFTTQAGVGMTYEILPNFDIDASAKFQVVKSIKFNSESLDTKTLSFKPNKTVKKTIAVGEFSLGFTYKLPF